MGHQSRLALLLVLLPAASAGQKAKRTLDQHNTALTVLPREL